MPKASQGQWVEIADTILEPEQRSATLPVDTAAVPYTFRLRGIATEPGELGRPITIRTQSGRLKRGTLVQIEPSWEHNFGRTIPELIQIRISLKKSLSGADE